MATAYEIERERNGRDAALRELARASGFDVKKSRVRRPDHPGFSTYTLRREDGTLIAERMTYEQVERYMDANSRAKNIVITLRPRRRVDRRRALQSVLKHAGRVGLACVSIRDQDSPHPSPEARSRQRGTTANHDDAGDADGCGPDLNRQLERKP